MPAPGLRLDFRPVLLAVDPRSQRRRPARRGMVARRTVAETLTRSRTDGGRLRTPTADPRVPARQPRQRLLRPARRYGTLISERRRHLHAPETDGSLTHFLATAGRLRPGHQRQPDHRRLYERPAHQLDPVGRPVARDRLQRRRPDQPGDRSDGRKTIFTYDPTNSYLLIGPELRRHNPDLHLRHGSTARRTNALCSVDHPGRH